MAEELPTLVIGSKWSITFGPTTPSGQLPFTGQKLTLVFDHKASKTRLKFTETGCTVTVNGTQTYTDSTAPTIANDGSTVTWERTESFVSSHVPDGEWIGYFFVGPVTLKVHTVTLSLTVVLPTLGVP